ncbi:membrane protein [Pokkaliibacter plantistimulans]|uniref:Membrane protein n=1 Tax=Pokkaliibacter plantistimulans TaxID=1635171 RepID=A0ABX5M1I7_9GAMM|nr:DedA family protein [Pokkaliibacter plantistimulans]PXF30750.1 membrane protein [Pokkaliibacter plantistimulans]
MLSILTPDTLHHLMQSYGLWLLFSVIMLESMGLPLPGETLLVTAALYAATEHGFSIYAVIGVAALAAVVGDNLGYLIGRSVGWPLLHRYGKYVHLTAARLRVGQYLFRQHGGKIVFFGRFVAFLRAFAALLAGANRMHWSHFLLMNGLGGVVWATLFGSGAYLLGDQIHRIAGPVGLVLLVVAIVAIVVGLRFFRHHEKELERRAEAALAAQGE